MADRVINVTVSNVNTKNVTVSSKQVANEISATADSSVYYSQLAKNWAIGEGLIQNEDYSSKTYAGVAQEAAENAQGSADIAQALVNDFSGVVDNAITEIDGVKTEALTTVTSSKDLALSDISATQSSALTEIGDLKNSSLTEISASSTTALGNINNVGQNYIDNINATGKGFDNLTQRQITNCLLEVPQRIKYDLTDGVLTIKKGSQVIVPYGTTNENFTRVGSPTIVDGVASGFSASDYIEVETPLNTSNFTLEGEIVVPEVLGVEHGLIQFNNATKTRVIIGASTIFALYDDTAGRIIGCEMKQFRGNTIKYKFEVSPSGSKLTINDLTQNETFTYTSTKNITFSNVSSFIIGKSFNGGYGGQIDLKQFSITVDGKVVYRPYIQKGDRFLNDNLKVADTQFADGKFFVWAELQNDISAGTGSLSSYTRALFINAGTNGVHLGVLSACKSGTTPEQGYYYHTGENKMYIDTVLKEGVSLPLMYGEWVANTGYTSIDQVFNGMGYIGSTVWVDKGVKGLIPNGRNEDGSLNNVEFEVSSIIIGLRDLTQEFVPVWYQSDNTIVFSKGWEYVEATNKVTAIQDNVTTQDFCQIATVDMKAGVISNFQPKLPFHAPDIQDVVRKTGDTMSGKLSFNGVTEGGHIIMTTNRADISNVRTHHTDYDFTTTTAPSANKYLQRFLAYDKNNNFVSTVETVHSTNNNIYTQIIARRSIGGAVKSGTLLVGVSKDGSPYTAAPHCSNNTGIVTQAGLSKAANGYVKFGNGIIMQWGQASVSSNKATVTFPTAFSSVARVAVTPYSTSTGAQNNPVVTGLNKTSVTVYCEQTFHWLAIGY